MISTLQVRVKGRDIDTYQHEGKTYVEGRKGSEYTIHFRNNSSQRKKIVVSVDGLNVVTGDSNWERGYLVPAWGIIDIPGWRKSDKVTASFEFSSIKGGYNQQNDAGDKRNIGVIGCLVFDEKVKPIPAVYHHYYQSPWPYYWNGPIGQTAGQNINNQGPYLNSVQCSYTMNSTMDIKPDSYHSPIGVNFSSTAAASSAAPDVEVKTSGGSIADRPRSASRKSFADTSKQNVKLGKLCAEDSSFFVADEMARAEPEQKVSTGWGRDKEFKTTTVEFDAQELASETLLVYYDSRDTLMRLGIIPRPTVPFGKKQPNAFPGYRDGCPEPKYVMRNK